MGKLTDLGLGDQAPPKVQFSPAISKLVSEINEAQGFVILTLPKEFPPVEIGLYAFSIFGAAIDTWYEVVDYATEEDARTQTALIQTLRPEWKYEKVDLSGANFYRLEKYRATVN